MTIIQAAFLGIILLFPLISYSSDSPLSTASVAMRVSILDNTCSIDTELGNVDLGSVALKDIRNRGGTSVPVKFTVTLKDCGMYAKNVQVIARGLTVVGKDNVLALSAGGDTAQGIGVYLRDNKDKIVAVNHPDRPVIYKLTAGSHSALNFSAQYVATSGSPLAGKADSEVNLEFLYE